MKKFVVVGNCQARPLAGFIGRILPAFEAHGVVVVHLSSAATAESDLAVMSEADIIFAQSVGEGYRAAHVVTNRLRESFGDKVVVWPNAFFHGQCTDTYYLNTLDNRRVYSPLAEYHSLIVYNSWQTGKGAGECVRNFLSDTCDNADDIRQRARSSLDELRRREASTQIRITDTLEAGWQSSRQFFTFNHPARSILHDIARQLISAAGLRDVPDVDVKTLNEPLGRFVPVVPPAHARLLGLTFPLPSDFVGSKLNFKDDGTVEAERAVQSYDINAFVELSYRCYDLQLEPDTKLRITPAQLAKAEAPI